MTDDLGSDIGQGDLGDMGFQPNVLEILRRGPGLSLEDINGIDENIIALTGSVSERLDKFASEKMQLEHAGIDVYDTSLKSIMDGEELITARINGDEEEFLAAVAIKPSTFRVLLAITLLGDAARADLTEPVSLSASERCIFKRFTDQLMVDYFESNSDTPELQIPRRPTLVKDEELFELAFVGQLVRITYSFGVLEERYEFYLLLSQSLLETRDDAENNEDGDFDFQASAEASWKKSMMNAVEHLGIPFQAQIAEVEHPLTYVSSLEVGQTLDVEIELDQLKIVDDEGQPAFLAQLDMQNGQLTIRAAGSISKTGK